MRFVVPLSFVVETDRQVPKAWVLDVFREQASETAHTDEGDLVDFHLEFAIYDDPPDLDDMQIRAFGRIVDVIVDGTSVARRR